MVKTKGRDALAAAFLALLVLFLVGEALRPGKVLLPLDIVTQLWAPWRTPNQPVNVHNVMLMDVVNYVYPIKTFLAETVRDGRLPLWNPYEFTGYPFTYNTQAGPFYPLTLLYYFLPAVTAVDLTIILQMWLGAWFMYLYLRRIRLRRVAALAGAVLFTFNGLMVGWLEWQVVQAAVIWLPAQFYAVERLADRLETSRRFASALAEIILLAVLFAIPWLGGHWSWAAYGSMTLVVYLVLRIAYGVWRAEPPLRNTQYAIRATGVILLSLALGVALSLIQTLPAVNYLRQSHRQAMSVWEFMSQGLFNRGVLFFLPNFFGNPAHQNWQGPANSNFAESVVYAGILPLFLAVLVLFLRRGFYTRFFAAWGGLTLLWALGSPAYFMLYFLPMFNGIQPSRAVFLTLVCLAVLSALAIDRLMEAEIERPRFLSRLVFISAGVFALLTAVYFVYYRADAAQIEAYLRPQTGRFLLFLVGSAALLLLRIRGRLRPRSFAWLALAWLTADLFLFGYGYNTVGDTADLYPPRAATAFLQNDAELYRIVTLAEGLVFRPNTSLVPRIPNLSGYEPGVLRRIVNLLALAEPESPVRFGRVFMPLAAVDSPLLDMLNVKYVTTKTDYWQSEAQMGIEPEAAAGWAALPAERPFTLKQAGLQRLDVWLKRPEPAQGQATAQILSADGAYEFARATLDAAGLPDEGPVSFYFAPFPAEWGRDFRFRVTFAGGAEGAQIAVNEAGEPVFAAWYLPRPALAFEEGETRIYLNEGYFPRAFWVPRARIAADEAAALEAVAQNMGRLREVVILELEGQPPPPLGETAVAGAAQIEIQTYDLNRVQLTADLEQPGFLVLSDTYYPGWRVTVDGEETAVYRANSVLRAVYLPAGRHEVLFSFLPPDFIWGGVISLLALLLCLLGLAYAFARKR